MPEIDLAAGVDRREPNGPPARHQQEPGPDRPVEARQPQVGARPGGGEAVDPVSSRIGDATRAAGHRASGLPDSVSKVPWPFLVDVVSGTTGVVPRASLRLGPLGRGPLRRHFANLLARLRGPAVSGPDLLEHFSGDAAGRALLFQALDHLGLGREERLEQFAQFLRLRLLLTGRLQRLAVLLGLIPKGQELLAGRRRLLRLGSCPELPTRSSAWGHHPPDPGMPGMPPNCAAAGQTGNTASISTNGTARLSVMM